MWTVEWNAPCTSLGLLLSWPGVTTTHQNIFSSSNIFIHSRLCSGAGSALLFSVFFIFFLFFLNPATLAIVWTACARATYAHIDKLPAPENVCTRAYTGIRRKVCLLFARMSQVSTILPYINAWIVSGKWDVCERAHEYLSLPLLSSLSSSSSS